MKKMGIITLVLTVLLFSEFGLFSKSEAATNDEITVTYNGEKLEFDQKPIIQDGRTKVPFRKIFESMGAIVYYNQTESSIMALTKTGDLITHKLGTNKAEINGEEKTFDSSSALINGRTVVPVRMVSELLGADVDWNEKTRKVTIEKNEEKIDSVRKEVMNHVLDVNYNPKDTNRYVEYKKKNSSMTVEQVIMDVNMDLDREFILYTEENIYQDNELYSIEDEIINNFYGYSHYNSKIEDREEINNPNDILALVNNFNTIDNNYEPNDLMIASPPINPGKGATFTYYLREEAANKFIEMRNAFSDDVYAFPDRISFGYQNAKSVRIELNADYRYYASHGLGQYHQFQLPQNRLEIFAYELYAEPCMNDIRLGLSFRVGYSIERQLIYYLENYYNIESEEITKYKNSWRKEYWDKDDDELYWLKTNSYKYGFIERYPDGKQNITRRGYLPWHYRYVGVEAATQMYEENLCLEEYWAKYLNPTVNDKAYAIDAESTQNVLQTY